MSQRTFKLFTGAMGNISVEEEDYLAYPATPDEAFRKINDVSSCGISYEELKARGASDEAIRLVEEKYEFKRKHPEAHLELIHNGRERQWIITGNKTNPTGSYRFDILNLGGPIQPPNMQHYKSITREEMEQSLEGLRKYLP